MVEQDQCECDVVESRQHDPVDPRCSLRLLAGFRQVKVKEMGAGKGLHVLVGMRRRTCGHSGGCHVPCCTLYESSARFVCSLCVCARVGAMQRRGVYAGLVAPSSFVAMERPSTREGHNMVASREAEKKKTA
jgi:hypothetical protein